MKSTRRQFMECALGVLGGAMTSHSLGMPTIFLPVSDLGLASGTLDLPEAKRLDMIGELVVTSKFQPGAGFARLWQYTKATPEAIEYLSNKNCTSLNLGIHEIDQDIVKILQSWESLEYLRLNRLKTLSPECAKDLCGVGADLRLGLVELDSVSVPLARELAKNQGWLYVGLPSSSVGAIGELSKHQGKTGLDLMIEPSYEDAIAIAHHRGSSLILTLPPEGPSPSLVRALSSNLSRKVEIQHYGDSAYAFSSIEISDLDYVNGDSLLRWVWLG